MSHTTIETTTSVTVIHGAMLSFESIGARDSAAAPLRRRERHETLLRVIDGTIVLELGGDERTLTVEGEARIAPSVPHRIWSTGAREARIVTELRRTS